MNPGSTDVIHALLKIIDRRSDELATWMDVPSLLSTYYAILSAYELLDKTFTETQVIPIMGSMYLLYCMDHGLTIPTYKDEITTTHFLVIQKLYETRFKYGRFNGPKVLSDLHTHMMENKDLIHDTDSKRAEAIASILCPFCAFHYLMKEEDRQYVN